METMELPGGVTVRTFTPPPAGFDPLTADDRELLIYGYPSRPTDEALLKRWEHLLSRSPRMIQPTFRAMPHKRRQLPKSGGSDHGVENTNIWSGAVVHAPANDTFKWVEGTWTVPDAYPPMNATDGVWYSASSWVGIDGIDGSGDVLQAGCDSDVMTSGGNVSRQLNPWWEWYPAGSFWISNLAISQGDTVNCLICVTEGSTTSALILLYNVTSNISASFQATAPTGTNLVGNSAEWVIERLEIDTNTPELARYGDVYFDEANAGTVGNATLHAGSGNTINMVDNGNVISTGTIETQTLVQVRYTGPNN
jgi:hypothetical protein